MRYGPVAVHTVAVKAATDLIKEPAAGHPAERHREHGVEPRGQGPVLFDGGGAPNREEEVDRWWGWEFWRAAEAAIGVIMLFAESFGRREQVGGLR